MLVTVGTTNFDALVRALDRPETAEALVALGYTRLVLQIGATAAYEPAELVPAGAGRGESPSPCRPPEAPLRATPSA